MRWGVTEEMTTNVCFEELEKCQIQSIGPSFVVFFVYLM